MTERILIVDDEPEMVKFVERVAEGCGYDVRTAGDAASFWTAYRSFEPGVIAVDLAMPEVDGIELLGALADAGCRAKLLIISGFDAPMLASAKRLGEARGLEVAGTVLKPVRVQDLRDILNEVAGRSGTNGGAGD